MVKKSQKITPEMWSTLFWIIYWIVVFCCSFTLFLTLLAVGKISRTWFNTLPYCTICGDRGAQKYNYHSHQRSEDTQEYLCRKCYKIQHNITNWS